MPHFRTALRDAVKSELQSLSELGGVTMKTVLSRRIGVDDLPEMMVHARREPSRETSTTSTERALTLDVILRRKGKGIEDVFDVDSAAIEAAVLPLLKSFEGTDRATFDGFETEFDVEGSTPVGQAMLRFTIMRQTRQGASAWSRQPETRKRGLLMGLHSGTDGLVKHGANIIDHLASWEINETAAIYDASAANDTWDKHVIGNKSWSGQMVMRYDADAAANQTLRAGDTVSVEFYSEGEASGRTFFSGVATVTDHSVTSPHDNVVERTYQFTGQDSLSIGTVA